ncbi:MAG: PAS domain S-box protein, partial [Deltaproteobacteria bacterium]
MSASEERVKDKLEDQLADARAQIAELKQALVEHRGSIESPRETVSKQVEAELREQRAFFEQMFTQSSVSTQILDKDGWCERINPKLSQIFGVQPEHIEGGVYNIFKDEEIRRGGVLPHLERVFQEGKTAAWEVQSDTGSAADSQGIQVKEKKRVWYSSWAYPIFDETGALSHVVIQHTDISDRKRTAAALEASEERHRILFERSPSALMTLAPPSWNFTAANPATLAMFGVASAAEMFSRGPLESSPERQPDGRMSGEKALEMIETAMREGAHTFEWTHRRVSGEEFPATVLLARMEIDGEPFLQATVRDETEKRRLQASLAQGDRLASMGMLAAGVAHEINNPLTYVLSSVESLVEDLSAIDPEQFTHGSMDDVVAAARSALEGTRRIKRIIRGLSTFSRVEHVDLAKVDLHEAIDSAVAMAQNEIRYRAGLVKDYGV